MSHIDIGATLSEDGTYHCSVEVYQGETATFMNITLTRYELKELRNSLHNALIDLNMELGYEP